MKQIIIHVIAYSGSGKTTLIEKLIKELKKNNIDVDVIKHDDHNKIIIKDDMNNYGHIKMDNEIKDTIKYLNAGANNSIVSSDEITLIENNNKVIEGHLSINQLIDLCKSKIIIIEGFKNKSDEIYDYKGNIYIKIGINRLDNNKNMPYELDFYDYVFTDDINLINNKKIYNINEINVIINYIRGIV